MCGLLVEGNWSKLTRFRLDTCSYDVSFALGINCKSFKIELKHEAQMVQMNAFKLITDPRDLARLPNIISCMLQLKVSAVMCIQKTVH